jgi:hypothetical protein
MSSVPSVSVTATADGEAAADGDSAAVDASVEGAVLGALDVDALGLVPGVHAAMNAARLLKPVAARNRRRVIEFADTRRTIASSSYSRDAISTSSGSPAASDPAGT